MVHPDRKYHLSHVKSVPNNNTVIIEGQNFEFAVTPRYKFERDGIRGRKLEIRLDAGLPVEDRQVEPIEEPTIHAGFFTEIARLVSAKRRYAARLGTNDACRLTVNPDDQNDIRVTKMTFESNERFHLAFTSDNPEEIEAALEKAYRRRASRK